MNYLPLILGLLGVVLGAILPIATVLTLICVGLWVLVGLVAVLACLVITRPGRWALVWRGQHGFVAVGVEL